MKFSTFIETNLDEIVSEWEAFASTLLPAAATMGPLALKDHCREILLAAAKDMETHQSAEERTAKSQGESDSEAPADTAATLHGALRARDGFDLVQLVGEFRALRASVLNLWRKRASPVLSSIAVEEVSRFNEAIDQALAESVVRYAADQAESRDLFVAILGHDLRNPLAVVAAASQLLEKPGLADAARLQAVARIRRSATTMNRLIADLLGYARIRLGGGMPMHRSACNLGRLCEEALDSARANQPGRQFTGRLAGDLMLAADPVRMEQAISNLLSNAAQHGDASRPVELEAVGDGQTVQLSVTNFGVAISPETLPHVFEPLVQGTEAAPASQERSKTSLGLGLFIVREIAEGHGGTVAVQSSAETGTRFTMRFPRHGKAH